MAPGRRLEKMICEILEKLTTIQDRIENGHVGGGWVAKSEEQEHVEGALKENCQLKKEIEILKDRAVKVAEHSFLVCRCK